ncbi:hypothetical protein [Marinobacter halotolerans]|uniref:hypothetical protein n=1 Tax=Marinobacter halotolerans TaxID=1569211 RepID=UPI001244C84E|nr:hypothetical protein [Marinobacter halotolerans]
MSIRQFNGRVFFRDRSIQLKIGGPVCDDGQQTVIARDENSASIRIIRCDVDSLSFQELGQLVQEEFSQPGISANPSAIGSTDNGAPNHH